MDLHVALTSSDSLYWFGWAFSIFVIVFPLWLGRNSSTKLRRNFEKSWAALLLLSYLAMTGISMYRGEASWATSLLVHMCGFSRVLAILYLFKSSRWIGVLVTFTGIAGGLQSLLTPEFTYGLHPVYVFDYFFNHASIVGIGIYIIMIHKERLQKFSWLKAFGQTQVLALIAVGINLLTGGNYMYLMEPPIADNPLIITSESFPYMHVVFFEIFAALNFWIIQLLLSRIKVDKSVEVNVT